MLGFSVVDSLYYRWDSTGSTTLRVSEIIVIILIGVTSFYFFFEYCLFLLESRFLSFAFLFTLKILTFLCYNLYL